MKIAALLEAYQTNLQKMIAKKRKSASAGKQQCEWFAGCKNPATGSTPHPVFPNGVPTCPKCHKFATGEERGIAEAWTGVEPYQEPEVSTIKLGGKKHPTNRIPIQHFPEFKKKYPGAYSKFRGPRHGTSHTKQADATHFWVHAGLIEGEERQGERRQNDDFYKDSRRSGDDRRSAGPSADPYVLTPGKHHAYQGPAGTYVTLKTTEPRGVPMQVISGMANQAYGYSKKVIGPFKAAGMNEVTTLAGWPTWEARKKVGWDRFKPAGLVFRFDESIPENTAMASVRSILDAFKAREEKFRAKREKHKAGAPARAKAAAASYRVGYQKDRQALYDKYGKSNVLSVTARQIGGDDGYQWNVLINNRPMVNGLTQSQVPHYKQQAYEILLKKFGKR